MIYISHIAIHPRNSSWLLAPKTRISCCWATFWRTPSEWTKCRLCTGMASQMGFALSILPLNRYDMNVFLPGMAHCQFVWKSVWCSIEIATLGRLIFSNERLSWIGGRRVFTGFLRWWLAVLSLIAYYSRFGSMLGFPNWSQLFGRLQPRVTEPRKRLHFASILEELLGN